MKVYQTEELQERLPRAAAICLGVFDGVHVGHQLLIKETIKIAKNKNLLPLVHTYDPLPFNIIRPGKFMPELTNLEERIDLMKQYGINDIAVSKFTRELQRQTGQQFFNDILLNKLHTKHLIVGFNHRFGYHGDTDAEKLSALCEQSDVGITIIPAVRTQEGDLVSSTAIRAAIMLQDWSLVKKMLGREPSQKMIHNTMNPLYSLQNAHNNGGS